MRTVVILSLCAAVIAGCTRPEPEPLAAGTYLEAVERIADGLRCRDNPTMQAVAQCRLHAHAAALRLREQGVLVEATEGTRL